MPIGYLKESAELLIKGEFQIQANPFETVVTQARVQSFLIISGYNSL